MSPRNQYLSPIICHCLGVTEADVHEAAQSMAECSLRDLISKTGAGNGCTACVRKLQTALDQAAAVHACLQ